MSQVLSEQSAPTHPASHWHLKSAVHVPWHEQLPGQPFTEQSSPEKPSLQKHVPL